MIRTDTNAKGRFVWHSAGLDGQGGSSYIDSVILRDKDANTAWTTAADGTLEERLYYAQNWRADVSLVLSSTGQLKERIKYSAYGVPYCISLADYNGDGAVTQADLDTFTADNNADDLRSDINFDGTADFFDYLDFVSEYNGGAGESGGGRSSLSRASINNRIGYAGYQWDPSIRGSITGTGGASAGKYHVRYRVLDAGQGRWTRRDPLGYVDGASVYEYVSSSSIRGLDPMGLDGVGTRRGNPPGEFDPYPMELPPRVETPTPSGFTFCYRPWTRSFGPITVTVSPTVDLEIGHCYIKDPNGNTTGWGRNGFDINLPADQNGPCLTIGGENNAQPEPDSKTWCIAAAIIICMSFGDTNNTPPKFDPWKPYRYPSNDCNDFCDCVRAECAEM